MKSEKRKAKSEERIPASRVILRPPMSAKTNAWAALLLLTALNFLNYIDRNVLFAVQPLIQKEFAAQRRAGGLFDLGIFCLLHDCRAR